MSSFLPARRAACCFGVTAVAIAGCLGADADPHGEVTRSATSALAPNATVEDAIATDCDTGSIDGLDRQIVGEVNCLIPNVYSELPDRPNLQKGADTFPFMERVARDALVKALDANTGLTLHVNSMLRTVAEQYLLYNWYRQGRCGIQIAATPGKSNHESGLAFDTGQYGTWRGALEAQGFRWFGSGDVVHFDYTGIGAVDLRGKDVLAFQKLWNMNHPDDALPEDGVYGGDTADRLKKAPAAGFPVTPKCDGVRPIPPPKPATTNDGGAGAPPSRSAKADPSAAAPHDAPITDDPNANLDDGKGGSCRVGGGASPAGLGAGAGMLVGLAAFARRRRRLR